ncbi:PLAC8 family-domain-containing protein [Microdochium trichocladiopsis]|uniref:PLAC8 family-domain-containing protein n=1 Tax=Microdochium trichocladiopsis TaxID=1682393 RepID=A0A9P8YEL4_9PEZI|nr:PLAC8 family-domain-containing protein [Microdochium trichocladiopsis]KAH7038030.1 PLAC8 family-domain-containing protein [Microdochium trichocladiopsis]
MAAPVDQSQQNFAAAPPAAAAPPQEKPAPAAAAGPANGPINDADIEDWKKRFNEVLAKPSEHVNSKSPATAQSWTNSLFGCFSPIDLCCMTWCLPCVTFGKTHHRVRKNGSMEGWEPINTSCLMFCASSCFALHWIPMSMQRADIRARYNLQGSCLVDIATACCCGLCDLVQAEKESEQREALLRSNGPAAEQYRPAEGMAYGPTA